MRLEATPSAHVLADNMAASLAPIRARAVELDGEAGSVERILADGAARASALAAETLGEVRERMGFLAAGHEHSTTPTGADR